MKGKLTVDDKDVGLSRAVAANIQEMDVVLSEGHHRIIIIGEVGFLDEIPCDGTRICRLH